MSLETPVLIQEARRQLEICNACRYCEGFCSVFPAMMRNKMFADGDISHMANLCHNCRGCYYACQYAPPHEFQLNLPAALAEVRQDSWESYVWPQGIGRLFHNHGMAIMALIVLVSALFFGAQAEDTFFWSGTIGTLILLVAYVLTTIGAIRLVFVQKKLPGVPMWQIVIPIAALVVLGYTIVRNVFPYPAYADGAAFWFPVVAGVWLLAGLAAVLAMPAVARRAGT